MIAATHYFALVLGGALGFLLCALLSVGGRDR